MKSNNYQSGIEYLIKQQQHFVLDVARLINKASELDVKLTIGEAYRTIDQQLLYYHGLTLKPVNTSLNLLNVSRRSRALMSNHMKRLAIDFNFFILGELVYKDSRIEELGNYWESLHPQNRWGGHFKDFYDSAHFERHIS